MARRLNGQLIDEVRTILAIIVFPPVARRCRANIARPVQVGVCVAALVIALAYPNLPDLSALTDYRTSVPLQVFTADAVMISEFGTEHRSLVSIRDVPQQIRNAIVVAEDERSYQHAGVDYQGVLRAAYANLASGGAKQGASTISCHSGESVPIPGLLSEPAKQ